jgi:uncharacterized protein YdaU (DUF1376 family)
MSKTPFMPLWVSDFLGDTIDLDASEIGAYMLLLMAQWNRNGESLPNDSEKLKRICRCGRGWPKVWGVLERFFQTDEDGIYSKRLRSEAASVAAKRLVNSRNGALGGKSKSLKSNNDEFANAKVSPERNASIPEPEPYSVDKSTGANAPIDPVKVAFDNGRKLLIAAGVSPAQAGSMVGKWRKDLRDDAALIEMIGKATREGAVNPIEFIQGMIRARSKPKTPEPGDYRQNPSTGRRQVYMNHFDGWVNEG